MATSHPLEEPPYRSYEELRRDRVPVFLSTAAKRLFWPLDGVFPAAISVMKTPRSADDIEPFFRPDTGSGGTWHEISQLSLTEPKVSSVEASVRELDEWEGEWLRWHENHACKPDSDPKYVTYGDLSDEDRPFADEPDEDGNWEADSDTEFLVKCCGEDRPLRKRGIKLVVTSSAGNGGFVTIRDYVGAVHPWLMSMHADIVSADSLAQMRPMPPAAPPTELMVGEGPKHRMVEKISWLRKHGGGPPLPPAAQASRDRFLARIRAEREERGRRNQAKE
ncbi:uncharacterized protein E0L32_004320 [Thyridium curvatum]|uniref:Uncharacterized protein n=1 Tax=Thyridium curvatum TaxID=1093900 RepID=A0A507B062_9PEZI|nr:uncharacterized protein E0L32_004320 [Thyridium curvatum]TPX15622.1 hypothetical protein E0L32_004320 [Thyridium curvatum]